MLQLRARAPFSSSSRYAGEPMRWCIEQRLGRVSAASIATDRPPPLFSQAPRGHSRWCGP